MKEEKLRKLVIKAFHIEKVFMGDKTSIENGVLSISTKQIQGAAQNTDLIRSLSVNVIPPDNRNQFVNTIMDILPISCKVLGNMGEGITHTLTGVYAMICARDESGRQMAAFGSSEGILQEQIQWGKPGTPGLNDIILHIDVLLKDSPPFTRDLPNTVHQTAEVLIQGIREVLKNLDGKTCNEVHEYFDVKRDGQKKVVLVKLIAGQGACYDNRLFCNEPSGFEGGKSIIDMGNMPVVLTPNEYRDGAIRALT